MSLTATYRPASAGSNTNCSQEPATGANYDKVDEESSDGSTTYIYRTANTYAVDTYNFATPSETGQIASIAVHALVCSAGYKTTYQKLALYIGSTVYYGSEKSTSSISFSEISETWETNPADSGAWDWSDLTDLQFGIALKGTGTYLAACTRIWLVITYNKAYGNFARVVGLR